MIFFVTQPFISELCKQDIRSIKHNTLPYLNVSNARSKGRLRQIAHKPQDYDPHSHCSLHSKHSHTQWWLVTSVKQRQLPPLIIVYAWEDDRRGLIPGTFTALVKAHAMQFFTNGPCQITDMRLWPAADYEEYRVHVSIDKVRWRTIITSRSWRWRSQVAGIFSDTAWKWTALVERHCFLTSDMIHS